MKYCELREEEKAELRETLLDESMRPDGGTDFDSLSNEQKEIVLNCINAEDIPEEIMEAAFGIYDFVEDDFWCNV